MRCELYYSDDDLLPGDLCPIHKLPVEEFEEENYFFRLSRFQDRLLDWYAAHPGAIVPEFRGNEALGVIRSGLRDFSVSRTSLTWGIPLPWDPSHVTYVWFDALTNYLAAIGFGTDAERFEHWWPVDYHLIGKDIIRQHCVYWPAMLMSAGIEPPRGWAVGGWLLSGGEKMSKTTGNVVKPLDLIDTVGVDGFRYYVLADTPYGQDGDFTYEGLIGRYNADLANNLGNLTARVATVVGSKCGGTGPAPSGDSPLAQAAADAVDGGDRGVGRRRPEPGARGDMAAGPGDQRPPRGQRAVEARPGAAGGGRARRRSRGAADRGHPRLAGAPGHHPGDLGAPRPVRPGHRSARARRRRVGRLPRGSPGHQRPTAVPADHRVSERSERTIITVLRREARSGHWCTARRPPRVQRDGAPMTWIDSHCHLPAAEADELVAEAGAAGVGTMVTVGCDRATSLEALELAARLPGVFATVGLHPHEAKYGVATIADLFDGDGARPVAVGECGLDFHYDHSPRDDQRAAFAEQIRSPTGSPCRSSSTPERRGTTRSPSSTPKGSRRGPCSTASPAGPTRRGAVSTAAPTSASPGS